MCHRIRLRFAVAVSLAPAVHAGEPPKLTVLAGDLTDDIVVTASSPLNIKVEVAVRSSPVSLSRITDGLISDSPSGEDRYGASESLGTERRLAAAMVRTPPP